MIKAVSLVLRNLCTHSDPIIQQQELAKLSKKKRAAASVSSQHLTVQAGMLSLIMQSIETLADYDVHVNLYTAMGNLVLSPHSDVAQAAVAQGCLN